MCVFRRRCQGQDQSRGQPATWGARRVRRRGPSGCATVARSDRRCFAGGDRHRPLAVDCHGPLAQSAIGAGQSAICVRRRRVRSGTDRWTALSGARCSGFPCEIRSR